MRVEDVSYLTLWLVVYQTLEGINTLAYLDKEKKFFSIDKSVFKREVNINTV